MLSASRRKLSEMKQPRDATMPNGCLFLLCLDKTMTAGNSNGIDRRHGFLHKGRQSGGSIRAAFKKAITRRCRLPF
ncbi:hypothetical protein PQR64_01620 [Paraburkholderia phytofirmans]|uniref:hypothetical protein n=1 Tax=Paraburkholderia phytofirmans TaxID=261302 RepID=UPI0038BD93E8